MQMRNLVVLACAVAAACCLANCTGAPETLEANETPIDLDAGYRVGDVIEAEAVVVNDGILEEIVPMVEFECSGVVYTKKKDRQDGFEYSVTLVFGELAEPAVFEHLVNEGTMNKKFDDGFVLDNAYFKSHVAAFYLRPATENVSKALRQLEVGDPVRLIGDFVYLKTQKGTLKTSLNPKAFKCKYAYLTGIDTDEFSYR
jgi:hypothetical protein